MRTPLLISALILATLSACDRTTTSTGDGGTAGDGGSAAADPSTSATTGSGGAPSTSATTGGSATSSQPIPEGCQPLTEDCAPLDPATASGRCVSVWPAMSKPIACDPSVPLPTWCESLSIYSVGLTVQCGTAPPMSLFCCLDL